MNTNRVYIRDADGKLAVSRNIKPLIEGKVLNQAMSAVPFSICEAVEDEIEVTMQNMVVVAIERALNEIR